MNLILYLIMRKCAYEHCIGWLLAGMNIKYRVKNVNKLRLLKRKSVIDNEAYRDYGYAKLTYCFIAFEIVLISIVFLRDVAFVYGFLCAVGVFQYPDFKLYEQDKKIRHGINEAFPGMLMSVKLLILAGAPTVKSLTMVSGDDQLSTFIHSAVHQVIQGQSVTKVFLSLSDKAQLTSITRFSRIMIQDEKHGSKETIVLLDKLLDDIRKQRRTQILKKAEEASTKLLLPMMIALFGVLVAVTVPALSQLFTAF